MFIYIKIFWTVVQTYYSVQEFFRVSGSIERKTFKAVSVRYTISDDDSYQLFYNLNIVRTPDHPQSHDK